MHPTFTPGAGTRFKLSEQEWGPPAERLVTASYVNKITLAVVIGDGPYIFCVRVLEPGADQRYRIPNEKAFGATGFFLFFLFFSYQHKPAIYVWSGNRRHGLVQGQ